MAMIDGPMPEPTTFERLQRANESLRISKLEKATLMDALQTLLDFGNDSNTRRGAWAINKAEKAMDDVRRGNIK